MAEVVTKFPTKYSAIVEANRLESFVDDKSLLPIYASSTAKIFPYQIAAARFALRSDYLKGCILCDEGSLGKTYEAILIAGQKWYEGKENILIILPSNLVNQWQKKLNTHFTIPHHFWNNTKRIPNEEGLILTTYECALKYADIIKERDWDLVIFDEADVLFKPDNKTVITLKDAIKQSYRLLLTPTPITLSIMDIYGLIHFIDESLLPNPDKFYKRYFRKPENYPELTSWVSQFCFRTLKCQTTDYVSFSRRLPITIDYKLLPEEKKLYKLVNKYLDIENKVAYPDMDIYNLKLMFWKTLSSSTQAFAEMLDNAIKRTYGEEKELLLDIQNTANSIGINSKTHQLFKLLKPVFNHLKSMKVNQKAIIFVDKNTTLDYLYKVFLKNGYNTLKYKDNETLDRFRREDEIQILITTDKAAKGLDIEYCPVVVNYDMLYNAIEMEQRICRCHRQGQKSDVLVINFISKENFTDVRIFELINKRTKQFNGIFGMSDDLLGEFDVDIKEVLQKFRHVEDVDKSFKENLSVHKQENEELVEHSENVLFTTFTKSIADKITVTPDYIEDKIATINSDLWEIIKYYFSEIMPDVYAIDEENKTLTLIEGYVRPFLFTFKEDRFREKYEGYQKYGMSADFVPVRGRISLTSLFAKGLLGQLDMVCPDEAKIVVDSDIEPCEIAYYNVSITNSKDVSYKQFILIGQTKSGRILSEDECRNILKLPVINIEERTSFDKMRLGSLLTDFENVKNIDELITDSELMNDYFKNKEGSIAYEIEKIKLLSGRKKTELEVNIKDMKKEIDSLKKQIDTEGMPRMDEIRLKKKLRILNDNMRKQDNDLFFDMLRIDEDTKNEIAELTNEYNFKIFKGRKFRIQIIGK